MLIIYPNDSGGICVIWPTGALPIAQVAFKDVPYGVPFLYVSEEDLPPDRTYRDAWEADFSDPDGHGGTP